ncbi:hypothetical protein KUTeg_011244 [Tegillarca granosa]|uniref:Uncharacterized protein n=1 Tax=Tegillarca granosa TaxID=220873 RepID=A0ABQ9F1I8_TEGGR|nr:hypothetical protein KUTeg_011244 [Tegillarca granosa]
MSDPFISKHTSLSYDVSRFFNNYTAVLSCSSQETGERPGSETGTSVLQMGQGKVLGLFTSALEVLNTELSIP